MAGMIEGIAGLFFNSWGLRYVFEYLTHILWDYQFCIHQQACFKKQSTIAWTSKGFCDPVENVARVRRVVIPLLLTGWWSRRSSAMSQIGSVCVAAGGSSSLTNTKEGFSAKGFCGWTVQRVEVSRKKT